MVRALVLSLAALIAHPLTPAALGAAEAASAPAAEQPLSALRALAETAVANGIPDAAGGRILRGPVGVVRRMGDARQVVHQDGLHLKLADGRWLIRLGVPTAAADVEVDEAALQAVDPAGLPEAAVAYAHGWNPEAMEKPLQRIAPADRGRIRAALPAIPVAMATGNAWDPSLLVVHLLRLGAPCAADVAVINGLARAWNPLSDTLRAAPLRLVAEDWRVLRSRMAMAEDLRVPSAEEALRAGLFDHFRGIVVSDEGGAGESGEPGQSAAVRLAALASAEQLLTGEAALARADLALLRGRLALPTTVAADAPLAERLAVWAGDLATPETEPRSRGPAPLAAGEADVDALIALLDDPRPCRWLDHGRARTIGDNALRALGAILCCDPRTLAGRDPAAPWTPDERAASIAAIRAWRTATRDTPLDELIEARVAGMRPADVATLLARRPAARRASLLAAVAKAWAAAAPAGLDPDTLVAVLGAADGDAGLGDAIAGWTVEGDLALALAAFHLTRGDRAPLATLLASALAPGAEDGPALRPLVAALAFSPTSEDLQRLVALLRGPLDQPPTAALVQLAMSGGGWHDPVSQMLQAWHQRQAKGDQEEAGRRAQLLPAALYAVLLTDQRPATPEMRNEAEQMRSVMAQGTPPPPLAADLRVADIAGSRFGMLVWQLGQLLGDDLRGRGDELVVDAARPVAERDRQLAALRSAIATRLAPALEAAGLPDLAPAGTPVAGDEKALF